MSEFVEYLEAERDLKVKRDKMFKCGQKVKVKSDKFKESNSVNMVYPFDTKLPLSKVCVEHTASKTVCTINEIELKLGQFMARAPFGDLGSAQTKVDSEVRNCLTLHDVELTEHTRIEVAFENIIERMLNQQAAEFYSHSLNIYPPAGHFKQHVDTPRHDPARMVGTVVFFLKNCTNNGLRIIGQNYGPPVNSNTLHGVFFFGDMLHEVLPNNSSDNRITLTYDVVLGKNPVNPTVKPINIDHKGVVAYCLKNQYSKAAIEQGVMKCSYDYQLFNAIKSSGKQFALVMLMVTVKQRRFEFTGYCTNNNEVTYYPNNNIWDDSDKQTETVCLDFDLLCDPRFAHDTQDFYDKFKVTMISEVPVHLRNVEVLVNPLHLTDVVYEAEKYDGDEEGRLFAGNTYEPGVALIRKRIYHCTSVVVNNSN